MAEGFEGVHGGNGMGEKMRKKEDCWSSVMKESGAWQIPGFKRQT